MARSAPCVSHLLFADDSLIFGDASTQGASKILQVLHSYANFSGKLVNFENLCVFFSSNVTMSNRLDVERVLGVRSANKFEKYLGLPCMVGRDKRRAFTSI